MSTGVRYDPFENEKCVYDEKDERVDHMVVVKIIECVFNGDWAANGNGTAGANSNMPFYKTLYISQKPFDKTILLNRFDDDIAGCPQTKGYYWAYMTPKNVTCIAKLITIDNLVPVASIVDGCKRMGVVEIYATKEISLQIIAESGLDEFLEEQKEKNPAISDEALRNKAKEYCHSHGISLCYTDEFDGDQLTCYTADTLHEQLGFARNCDSKATNWIVCQSLSVHAHSLQTSQQRHALILQVNFSRSALNVVLADWFATYTKGRAICYTCSTCTCTDH